MVDLVVQPSLLCLSRNINLTIFSQLFWLDELALTGLEILTHLIRRKEQKLIFYLEKIHAS
jgi:hypothetical protein